jgi:hypothetical protein
MNRLIWLSVACGIAAGCSSSPADVAGSFTVNVTDEADTCNLVGWAMGSSTAGIPVTITQTDATMDAKITGVVGNYVATLLGDADFKGTVSGDSIDATLYGVNHAVMDDCSYTYNAELKGDIDTDTLMGTITYTPQTNRDPSCTTDMIQGCTAVQDFNGTRPPM